MLNRYMDNYLFREHHQLEIKAPANTVYECARSVDYSESRITRLLFRLRGMPNSWNSVDSFVENGFVYLEEDVGNEFCFGFITDLRTIEKVEPAEFYSFDKPGYIKGITSYKVIEQSDTVVLSTETRLICTNRKATIICALYWACIRPFSGIIRMQTLNLVKSKACQ